jgi:hypothetical protein
MVAGFDLEGVLRTRASRYHVQVPILNINPDSLRFFFLIYIVFYTFDFS